MFSPYFNNLIQGLLPPLCGQFELEVTRDIPVGSILGSEILASVPAQGRLTVPRV